MYLCEYETLAGSQEPGAMAGTICDPLAEGVVTGLRRMGKLAIAMLNRPAAGGFDLALACDMRIGSENDRFTAAFTKNRA